MNHRYSPAWHHEKKPFEHVFLIKPHAQIPLTTFVFQAWPWDVCSNLGLYWQFRFASTSSMPTGRLAIVFLVPEANVGLVQYLQNVALGNPEHVKTGFLAGR